MLVDAEFLAQLDVDVVLMVSVSSDVQGLPVIFIPVLLELPVLGLTFGSHLENVRVDFLSQESSGTVLGMEVRLGPLCCRGFGQAVSCQLASLMVLAEQVGVFCGVALRSAHEEHVFDGGLGIDGTITYYWLFRNVLLDLGRGRGSSLPRLIVTLLHSLLLEKI